MIEVTGLGARAGGFTLRDITFSVPAGAWGIVLGPAGAGKTTLLEMIAGVRPTTLGTVALRGMDVSQLPPEQRRIGMVYQHALLFPHLSVNENIAYAAKDHDAARDVAARLGADAMASRPVASLSGGERQIVALARALAAKPDVLLLDEPLAALDPRRRITVRAELRRMHRESGVTILHVTHDFIEAGTLGDIAIVLSEGTVAQVDRPDVLFRRPATVGVADFLGFENVFSGNVTTSGDGAGQRLLSFSGSGIDLIGIGDHPSGAGHAVIRAEDVTLAREVPGASSARNILRGMVVSVSRHGPLSQVTLAVGATNLTALLTEAALGDMGFVVGVPAVAIIKATAVHLC